MSRIPQCHPQKPYGARKMCVNCYNKWLRFVNPEYKKRCKEASSKARNKPSGIRARDNSLLKQRYGITIEDRDKMEENQDYKCAICKKSKKLVVEHCHNTGIVRGLTCVKCNNLVGALENNWYLIPDASLYIATKGKSVK